MAIDIALCQTFRSSVNELAVPELVFKVLIVNVFFLVSDKSITTFFVVVSLLGDFIAVTLEALIIRFGESFSYFNLDADFGVNNALL